MAIHKARKRRKILLYGIAIIVIISIFCLSNFIMNFGKTIDEIMINDVDLKSVPDGVFVGSCDTSLVKVEVEVTVRNHTINDIKLLKHINGKGEKAEHIPQTIIQAQSLNVDVITGATASSKVILKAVENALNNAK